MDNSDALKAAINSYKQQLQDDPTKTPQIRTIAKEFCVDRSTLCRRVTIHSKPSSEAHTHRQILTPQEEAHLVRHIRISASTGYPCPPSVIIELANYLIERRVLLLPLERRITRVVGKNWLSKFKKRHPEVCSAWTVALEAARIDGCTPFSLRKWFTAVGDLRDEYPYKACNIHNVDETGIAIGTSQSTRVLTVFDRDGEGLNNGRMATKGRKDQAIKKSQSRQEWVTSIECISASGRHLPPLVIMKAEGEYKNDWLPRGDVDYKDWQFRTSNKGGTNDWLGFEWLQYVFEPYTRPSNPYERRLLILDGHGSHVKAKFLLRCVDHRIDVLVLPPHTSHMTQPLDVGVFGPLKRAMAVLADKSTFSHHNRTDKGDFAAQLAIAREKAMNSSNILAGWRNSGLEPFVPGRVLRNVSNPSPPSSPTTPATPTPARQLSRTPLASLTSENQEFLANHSDILRTPHKSRFSMMTCQLEDLSTENNLLRLEVEQLRAQVAAKKIKRKGATVAYLDQHHFTQEQVIREIQQLEAENLAKKRARNARKSSGDSQEDGE